jgi:hypothetical protein
MGKFVLAFFLGMHGLIHLGYVTPAPPDPKYPFSLSKSWLMTSLGLPGPTVRAIGIILSALTVIGFMLTGLATAGVVVPQGWWTRLTMFSAAASLLLLILFWHTWLVLGILIDLALMGAILWLHWQPFPVNV